MLMPGGMIQGLTPACRCVSCTCTKKDAAQGEAPERGERASQPPSSGTKGREEGRSYALRGTGLRHTLHPTLTNLPIVGASVVTLPQRPDGASARSSEP